MKIDEIRLYHLVAMLPEPIGNALVSFPKRETLLVEVVAGDLTGWGEAWLSPRTAAAAIEFQLAARILGQDPSHILSAWRNLRQAVEGETAAPAIAALDMALHDLTARAYKVPVSTLIGGARRQRVTAYASGPFFKPGGHPYRDFEREIDGYLKAGFRAVKLRSGYTVEDDAEAVLAARRQIGTDRDLMVDFNQSCSARRAMRTADLMKDADLLWIEEPTKPTDVAGYRAFAAQAAPALAGGETFTNASVFLPFLAGGCLDILQPDIAICGGLTGVSQVSVLADLYDRPLIPHVWGSIVNFHAALHFVSTLPEHRGGGQAHFPYLEFDVGPNPLLELEQRPVLNADGTISVPDLPGLGLNLKAEDLQPYTAEFRRIG